MKALLIKSPWIEKIISGEKTWEIRSSNVKIREKIALVKSGSGLIFGVCDIVGCKSFSSMMELEEFESYHCIPAVRLHEFKYKTPYAWIISNALPLSKPIPYKHPNGAQSWVNLASQSSFLELEKILKS